MRSTASTAERDCERLAIRRGAEGLHKEPLSALTLGHANLGFEFAVTTRRAACSCGNFHLVATGEPVRISICHCLDCQRRTGSVFGAQARFPAEAVEIRGESSAYSRVADSGNRITFHFCPTCGATVYYQSEDQPELIAVPVGVFADPDFPSPSVSVYEARRHPWVVVPEDWEHHR